MAVTSETISFIQQMFCQGRKISIFWITLIFLVSGCGAQQESTPVSRTQTPVPTVILTSSFGVGDIASIPRQDLADLSNEEIVKALVSQWLESYKTDTSNEDAIVDYKIEKVIIQNHPTDPQAHIIALVTFAIQPVGVPNEWASFPGEEITENDL